MYGGSPHNTYTPENYASDPKWTPAIAINPHTHHPHKVEDAHKPDMAGPTMMKGSFDREVDTDMGLESLIQLDSNVDSSKVEEATNVETEGPAIAHASFEQNNDDEDNQPTGFAFASVLSQADADAEEDVKAVEVIDADKGKNNKRTKAAKPKPKAKKGEAEKAAKAKSDNKKEESGDKKKAEDLSEPGSMPLADLWGSDVRYSDQLANGDDADDKELEDEDDPRDIIVDDDGFVNQWDIDMDKAGEWTAVQLDQDVKVDPKVDPKKSSLVENKEEDRFSSELVNGDKDDDKDLIDINDKDDSEVDENLDLQDQDVNLLQLDDSSDRHGKGFANPGPAWTQIMAQISNKNTINRIL